MFVANLLTGQSGSTGTNTANDTLGSKVTSVSARIASMYGVATPVVERFVQAAVNLESRIYISAPVVIAIAIHESSFKSELFLKAGNPFGIKASLPWVGLTYTKQSDTNGTKYRVYDSPEEAVKDLGSFVKSRSWYKDVFDCPIDDPHCMINGLKKTEFELGYSTNPNWDEAIINIIQKLGLRELAIR